jgi:hypothetical protein
MPCERMRTWQRNDHRLLQQWIDRKSSGVSRRNPDECGVDLLLRQVLKQLGAAALLQCQENQWKRFTESTNDLGSNG